MAAGQGFKTFNTGDVLSAADTNGYLMQGIWVFADATARDAAVTLPQEGNACYLKDTDVIQVYSGSAWVGQSASNPISGNIVDAKGDIIAATAADTVSRLAVGADNTVLTADSSAATGLKWATSASGGITLLSTTTLSGSSTTVSAISGDYTNLMVIVRGINLSNAGNVTISTNITNVSYIGTPNGTYGKSSASIASIDDGFAGWSSGNTSNVLTMLVYAYSNTSGNKSFHLHGGYFNSDQKAVNVFGAWNSSSAMSSFTIAPSSGTFNGGSILVYGIK